MNKPYSQCTMKKSNSPINTEYEKALLKLQMNKPFSPTKTKNE